MEFHENNEWSITNGNRKGGNNTFFQKKISHFLYFTPKSQFNCSSYPPIVHTGRVWV